MIRRVSNAIFLMIALSATYALAQDKPAQEDIVKERHLEIKRNFERLTIEKQKEFHKYRQMAFEAMIEDKVFTSMVAIINAKAIFPKDVELMFLKGICYATLHDIDTAIECYEEVLAINPYHIAALMNMIEINFFAGRYEETIKRISHLRKMIDNKGGKVMPLLSFKHLVSLTKLNNEHPGKYEEEMVEMRGLYTFMDDNPYFYYANALREYDSEKKQDGVSWVRVALRVFRKPQLVEPWNKALLDAGYMDAHNRSNNAKK